MTIRRIKNKELFLNMLDLEVKRAKRYQDFFSILKFKLWPLLGSKNEDGLKTCWKILRDCLAEEFRESDIVSFLGNDQWAVIIPMANLSTASLLRSRLTDCLEYHNFKKKGCAVRADLICFPTDGTSTADLIGKLKDQREHDHGERG